MTSSTPSQRQQPPAPAAYRVDPSTLPRPRALQPGPHKKRPAAILVAHGMGQQIPFQTLDDVVEGLRGRDRARRPGGPLPQPVAKTVVVGGERLQRLETVLTMPDGSERDVHVYEAYWAPLTEGQVTLRDVMGFLTRGGITGAAWGWRPFRRWLFVEYPRFPTPIRTVLYLVVALAVVLALWFLTVLIVAIAAARAPLQTPPKWLSNALFADITTVLDALISVFVAFAACLGLARLLRRVSYVNRLVGALSIGTFVVALWATIAAAVASAVVMGYHVVSGVSEPSSLFDRVGWGDPVRSLNTAVDSWLFVLLAAGVAAAVVWWIARIGRELIHALVEGGSPTFTALVCVLFAALFGSLAWFLVHLSAPLATGIAGYPWRRGLAWPLVVVVAAIVRRFLIQYAGDVAAYVQPQLLDRFAELRQKIKDAVWRTARAVYSEPDYDDILLVGHSLGSVVMYDVLNRLLIDRSVGAPGAPEVATRTRLLLTFGSPLDKTAFIFGVMGQRSEAREALAASVQPLITQQLVRPHWINVYSRWDIISGALDYYDLPDRSNRRPVDNKRDPEATTLLAAHVEYWSNSMLFETLIEHLA